MDLDKLTGMIAPMMTPFDENEELDLDTIRKEIKYLLNAGIDGISTGGSTGEGALLSNEEIRKIIEIIIEENKSKIPIVAGIIKNSTREAIKTALIAKEAGADALLITPVFYFGATPEGNYEYYKLIAEEVGLPIIIYNVVPTNQITPKVMLKISEIEEVIGIKQVGIEALVTMVANCGDKIKVFSACDDMLYGTYVSGACGAISAMIAAVPDLCVQQWQAFKKGDQKTAMEIQRKLYFVREAYNFTPFPGMLKEIINQLGRPAGKSRSPILEPNKKEKEFIRKKLIKAGLL
ncbi:4-hydroxy-tetrahydrodipicolinate synthase [subsurface metagenome]